VGLENECHILNKDTYTHFLRFESNICVLQYISWPVACLTKEFTVVAQKCELGDGSRCDGIATD